ncbi:uncharacterized protein LOC106458638 [Limulus polyphemus]|uniref:Uncharacterized protein LOC106458638 n=1 Tax=Limulus polyphemus TaxID=6850 RepID=A0ABM1B2S1_LIMPO|nr:uncharacterized protein LOC106458638 [Limulus polyphemus]
MKYRVMELITCVLLMASFVNYGIAGSSCPPEEYISPWFCIKTSSSTQNFYTIVVCNRPECKDHLYRVDGAAGHLVLDKVIITGITNNDTDKDWNLKLPSRWLLMSRVRELEIRDTTLSDCFLCNNPFQEQDQYLKKLVFSNCSLKGKLCNECTTTIKKLVTTTTTTTTRRPRQYGFYSRNINHFPRSTSPEPKYEYTKIANGIRMNGLTNAKSLESLDLSFNAIEEINSNAFPPEVSSLKILVLSHNNISVISSAAFTTLTSLSELDLSHNKLANLSRNIFDSPDSKLEVLNLNWNRISVLQENMFSLMLALKKVNIAHNFLQYIPSATWRQELGVIQTIDLSGNFLICDCDIKWILANETEITGLCSAPWKFAYQPVKRAAATLIC